MQHSDSVGFVINYYSRPSFGAAHRTTTTLCIQKLKENSGVGQIVLIDGSLQSDVEISEVCKKECIAYIHLDRELAFAESLNIGWKALDGPYVGFIANDIFLPQDTVRILLEFIKQPDIGCVFPYLSYCDYPGQMFGYVGKPVTCEPTVMTLNINVFKRSILEQVGGVDEAYSGSYNDLILLMKIRELGYRAVLVGGTNVFHLGQMTISQGSNYKKEKDREMFIEQYGLYLASHGMWQVKHWKRPLATTLPVACLWWLAQNNPSTRFRNWLQAIVMKMEPQLTKYPAHLGTNAR